MKKLIITFIISLIGGTCAMYGQTIIKDNELFNVYQSIPQEGIFIHPNASLFFAGERLYYSLYCLNLKTQNLSSLSKIAYVELVGKNNQIVFQHKIKLGNGLGQGDYFLPATVATGNYKLVGYTQWMKNSGKNHFFQADIHIINPYQEIPSTHLDPKFQDSVNVDSIEYNLPIPNSKTAIVNGVGNKYLSVATNGKDFNKREEVSLSIRSLKDSLAYGNYSISVRRKDPIEEPTKLHSHDYLSLYPHKNNRISLGINDSLALLELRGELISGVVVSESNNEPVENKKVVISLPGKEFVVDIANTNENGKFYFNLDEAYDNTSGILQLLDENKEEMKILVDKHSSPDYSGLEFDKFVVSEDFEELILKRSIHNQIENAYADVKSDTIIAAQTEITFYRDFQERYDLDDYTRFNTIEETMIEIIDHVWIKNNDQGEAVFQVRPFDLYLQTNGLLPMVILDGVFIQHHEDIMDLNAKRIERVYISRNRYMVGSVVFQGILALETSSGDFNQTYYKEYLNNLTLFKPQPLKKYFFQNHQLDTESGHVPDFRYQLFWQPNFVLDNMAKTINFYTSDIAGDYEIRLEGFTDQGKSISLKEMISVD